MKIETGRQTPYKERTPTRFGRYASFSPTTIASERLLTDEDKTPKLSFMRGLSPMLKPCPPKDKHNAVWLIQFLYGFAMLLTFNVLLSSLDYFQLKVSSYEPRVLI